MSLNENDIKNFINQNGVGSFVAIYGPSAYGDETIWEVWVKDNGEYQTRYVLVANGECPLYFDSFQSLSIHMDINFRKISYELMTMKNEFSKWNAENKRKDFLTYVCAEVTIVDGKSCLFVMNNDQGIILP